MHIGLPFRVDGRGRTARADDDEYVRGLVEQVLFTAPGERVNRPAFGSGVRQLVFEPAGGELADALRVLLRGALQQWLADRIEVEAVDTEVADSTLSIRVRYRTRAGAEARTVLLTRDVV
ncbi:GPW/gp25 family protein [Amycolatopsis sp. NBC_00438]|uniref:GPW/gp25 family protein n=1 Tax=Amycolatopsis sp. NBC_00438 TaxID=2903558 RepID=UPI002E1C3F4E